MKLLLSALLYSQLTLARLHQKVGCWYTLWYILKMRFSLCNKHNSCYDDAFQRLVCWEQQSGATHNQILQFMAGQRGRGIISMINFLVIFCKMEFSLHIKYWCPESSTAGRWGSLRQYILQHSDHQHQHTYLQPMVSRNYEGIEKNHVVLQIVNVMW